jgi:hypothetical protein
VVVEVSVILLVVVPQEIRICLRRPGGLDAYAVSVEAGAVTVIVVVETILLVLTGRVKVLVLVVN